MALDQAIDSCVETDMAALGTPGASVAVILDGELLYEAGYGVKHRDLGGEVDADTIFRIGSVTKGLTATAVMQQVEAGTIDLDGPVTFPVPELQVPGPWPADCITVRHLLTHTSGFPDLPGNVDGRVDDAALADLVGNHEAQRLHAPPGVFWNYSNPNFVLAGLVVERASGIPYREYMATHVFAPAGMTRTTFYPAEVMADGNYSFGHHMRRPGVIDGIYAPDDYDNAAGAPSGYAFSTAGDLATWALTLMEGGGAILEASSAAEMQHPAVSLELIPGQAYGYGVFVEPLGDLTLRQHGGNLQGWGAHLIWEHRNRFAVAVLANSIYSLTSAAYCIAEAVLDPGPGPPVDLPWTPEVLASFEGTWDFTDRRGQPLTGDISQSGPSTLTLYLEDPTSQWQGSIDIEYYGGEVFLADLDEDGISESDFSFLADGIPPRTNWLRSRFLVAQPRRPPRTGGSAATP
jgi:CubicO group peptidase (beta-lactamase class C family)